MLWFSNIQSNTTRIELLVMVSWISGNDKRTSMRIEAAERMKPRGDSPESEESVNLLVLKEGLLHLICVFVRDYFNLSTIIIQHILKFTRIDIETVSVLG